METVRIYRLDHLPRVLAARLRDAQMEAARVWTLCRDLHQAARHHRLPWPTRDNLQKATKGRFALHSQTVQMICHAFLANVQTTRLVKPQNPQMRYPYKDKRFYPLLWPAQAVSIERGRLVLPMGRGHASIVLSVAIPEDAGACQLVWKDGYELHVVIPTAQVAERPGVVHATVDLGEIHQGAVTTNTGGALVVSGRGLRSLKRRQNRALGQLAWKRSRCHHGSRRWRKLQRARRKVSAASNGRCATCGTKAPAKLCSSVRPSRSVFSTLAIPMGCAIAQQDGTIISAWPNGNMAKTSTI